MGTPAGPLACRRQEPVTAARGTRCSRRRGPRARRARAGWRSSAGDGRRARSAPGCRTGGADDRERDGQLDRDRDLAEQGIGYPDAGRGAERGQAARPLRPRAWRGPVCSFRPRRSRCRRPRRRRWRAWRCRPGRTWGIDVPDHVGVHVPDVQCGDPGAPRAQFEAEGVGQRPFGRFSGGVGAAAKNAYPKQHIQLRGGCTAPLRERKARHDLHGRPHPDPLGGGSNATPRTRQPPDDGAVPVFLCSHRRWPRQTSGRTVAARASCGCLGVHQRRRCLVTGGVARGYRRPALPQLAYRRVAPGQRVHQAWHPLPAGAGERPGRPRAPS